MTFDYEEWLTVDDVIRAHARALEKHGGAGGLSKPECPQSVLGNAWTAATYDAEQDPTAEPAFNFACRLCVSFSRAHCFTDGNKRVAWYCYTAVLRKLGFEILATHDEAFEFVNDRVVVDRWTFEQVADWTQIRLRPV